MPNVENDADRITPGGSPAGTYNREAIQRPSVENDAPAWERLFKAENDLRYMVSHRAVAPSLGQETYSDDDIAQQREILLAARWALITYVLPPGGSNA